MVIYNEKLRYNKKILNTNTIQEIKQKHKGKYIQKQNQKQDQKQKNILVGGNFLFNLSFGWKIVIITITIFLINRFIILFFKLKINGAVFPIVFGYIGINMYHLLNKHMEKLGKSYKNSFGDDNDKIIYITDIWQKIVYKFPKLIPFFPAIPNPTFNYQPFKGFRQGIQSLRFPGSADGENFRFSINFPGPKIPFIDPLAGLCCVWEQLKKLIAIVMKAVEPPKKIVEKIFGAIKRAITYIKDVIIMRNIKKITSVVGLATYPISGLLYVFMKFLDFITTFGSNSNIDAVKSKVQNILDKLSNFRTGDFGGGNMNNKSRKLDSDNLLLSDIYYNIHLLDYEEIHATKMNNVVGKLSIYKIYKIQTTKKQGLIRFINRYKKNKFSGFVKNRINKFKQKKNHSSSKTQFSKYNFVDSDLINELDKVLNKQKEGTYENYDLNDIKNKYHKVLINSKNIDKYKNSNPNDIFKQTGGGFFEDMLDALNIVKTIKKAIRDIPRKANVLCYIVELILSKVKIITDVIGKIQQIIFSKIPVFIKKMTDLIIYVNAIFAWFMSTVVDKGIRIIKTAMKLVKQLGKALPGGIGDAIFKPVELFFKVILLFLKLPFLSFFTGIVDILTNIPKFFEKVSDTIMSLCKAVSDAINKVLKIFLAPAEYLYKRAKMIFDEFMAALNALSSFGGSDNSGLNKLLYKNKYELSIMINKKFELSTKDHINKIDKDYLLKLDALIQAKMNKIEKIEKLLLKYKKHKTNKTNKTNKTKYITNH